MRDEADATVVGEDSEAMFATIKSSVETANDLIGNATKAAKHAAKANRSALTTTVRGTSDKSAA